jgi:hypothetical protein
MNLIYEELIKQSKPAPDFARTDRYPVGLTLHGTVQDPAFVRFVEEVSKETATTGRGPCFRTTCSHGPGQLNPKRGTRLSRTTARMPPTRCSRSPPDLKTEILNAVTSAVEAHTTISTQALNSETVREGLKDMLLGPAQLYETLRA